MRATIDERRGLTLAVAEEHKRRTVELPREGLRAQLRARTEDIPKARQPHGTQARLLPTRLRSTTPRGGTEIRRLLICSRAHELSISDHAGARLGRVASSALEQRQVDKTWLVSTASPSAPDILNFRFSRRSPAVTFRHR